MTQAFYKAQTRIALKNTFMSLKSMLIGKKRQMLAHIYEFNDNSKNKTQKSTQSVQLPLIKHGNKVSLKITVTLSNQNRFLLILTVFL